jgi:hypothetical protein
MSLHLEPFHFSPSHETALESCFVARSIRKPVPAFRERAIAFARAAGLAVSVLALGVAAAHADEFSITPDSTVIGQNTGYPSGTPSQGLPGPGQFDAVFEMSVFSKNLELIGIDPIKGETFFGVLAPLRLRYRADEKVSFEIGAVLGHNFGDDNKLDIAHPIFRIVAEPQDDIYIVAGTIFPTHWIHDALLDDVQRFRINAEQGMQFRIDRDHWKHDSWINWRVREGVVRAEEFEIGFANQFRLFDDLMRLDGQAFFDHAGGQISTSPRVEWNYGVMGGASLGLAPLFDCERITDVRLGGSYFFSSDDVRGRARETGTAWEARASFDYALMENAKIRVHGGYFEGDDFFARRGDPLYSLDEYAQAGVTSLFSIGEDLRLETGIVYQVNDADSNYTFMINLSLGQAFEVGFLKPRGR